MVLLSDMVGNFYNCEMLISNQKKGGNRRFRRRFRRFRRRRRRFFGCRCGRIQREREKWDKVSASAVFVFLFVAMVWL